MAGLTIGRALSATTVLLAIGLVAGCGEDDKPKSGNGVNDVKLACEIRAKWNRTGNDCSLCETGVVSPRCECTSLAAYSAACLDQADARKKACAESVDTCVFTCDRTDCACIEACYTSDTCKAASAARDGCIAEACESHCR
jgi:hypothetical protein